MLRDIAEGKAQVASVQRVISHVAPDIILLLDFDYDYGLAALNAFAETLDYPYRFALLPNTGMATGLDMDGDGRLGGPGDAQGFGEYSGQGGMAILSRFPILTDQVQDFSALLWRDQPGASLPQSDGAAFPSEAAQAVQRLSSTGHWDVPVQLPDGTVLRLLAFHAGTPAFGGPEDKNGLRNRDEVLFWNRYLPQVKAPFVLLGDANLDPADGEGHRGAMRQLLANPLLQDPGQSSKGAAEASALQGGVNAAQKGDPAFDTADWPDEKGPGNLRVDYVLPSADLRVDAAGTFWPATEEADAAILGEGDARASRHALVWADVGW